MVVGAYVNSVEEGSCAEKAGLQTGDIVTQVDGKDITTSAELIDAKNTHKAGEEMTLTVYRDNDYTTLKVTLDEDRPDADDTTKDGQKSNEGRDNNSGDGQEDPNGPFGGGQLHLALWRLVTSITQLFVSFSFLSSGRGVHWASRPVSFPSKKTPNS